MYIKPPSERVLLANKQFVVNMVTEELAELLSRPLSLVLRDHSWSAVNAFRGLVLHAESVNTSRSRHLRP
jgi:hypothetical protein